MDLASIFKFLLAVMFSPPGIANFILSTILKKRLHATVAAVLAASAFFFLNQKAFSQMAVADYSIWAILAVVAMMITSHLAFTIGEKVIRKKK